MRKGIAKVILGVAIPLLIWISGEIAATAGPLAGSVSYDRGAAADNAVILIQSGDEKSSSTSDLHGGFMLRPSLKIDSGLPSSLATRDGFPQNMIKGGNVRSSMPAKSIPETAETTASFALIRTVDGKSYAAILPPELMKQGSAAFVLQSKSSPSTKAASIPPRTKKTASSMQSATAGAYTLSGTIYGGGSPLSGATVALMDSSGSTILASTTTNATGFYSFSVDDGTYRLRISPPTGSEFGESVVNGVAISGANVTQNVVLILPATMLRGVVRGLGGAPVDAGSVNMYVYEQSSGGLAASLIVGVGGQYQVPLAKGTYKIKFDGSTLHSNAFPAFWNMQDAVTDLEVNGDTIYDIQLPFVRLSGKITNSSGDPLANVGLEMHRVGTDSWGYYNVNYNKGTTYSGASGDYSLILIAHNDYNLILEPPAGSALATTFVSDIDASQSLTRDFVISPATTLRGVIRGLNAEPISNVWVRLMHPATNQEIGITTDASGEYRFDVAKDSYDIWFSSYGNTGANVPREWGWYPVMPTLNLAGDTVMDIQVPMVSMSGKVTDSGGNPIPGVEFKMNHWWYDSLSSYWTKQDQGHVISDAQGRYSMTLLSHPDYPITLVPPADSGFGQMTFEDVNASQTLTRDFILPKATKLHGVVRGLRNMPLQGVSVSLYNNVDYTAIDGRETNEKGEYEFAVTEGTYHIELYSDGQGRPFAPKNWWLRFARRNIQVSGETICDFKDLFSEVSGKTTDRNGVPVTGVELQTDSSWYTPDDFVYNRNGDRWVISDDAGAYLMALIPNTYSQTIVPPAGSGFAQTVISNVDCSRSMLQNIILNFVDTRPPLIISGPRVTYITNSSAAVEWQTNEPATSQVDYGKTESLGQTATVSGYRTNHSIVLTGLEASTDYFAQAASSDESSNGPTTSTLVSFRTLETSDTQPPVIIEGPSITGITHNSLSVDWETDEPANSRVCYGTTESLGSTVTLTALAREHRVTISGLSTGTLHYLKVASTDASGNGPTESRIITARTLPAPDSQPPVIIGGPMAINISSSEATIIWQTNEPATSGVSYNDGTAYGVVHDDQLVLEHSVRLTGLKASTLYNYTVASQDSSGNGPTLSKTLKFTTLAVPDTKAPRITEGPIVINTTHQSAIIRWLTDEPADSVVAYGKTQDLGSTVSRTALVQHHNIALTNLEPNTKYYFRVLSCDGRGNGPTASAIYSFRTSKSADIKKPLFLDGPRVTYKSDDRAIIYWRTDKPTDSLVDYGEGLALDRRCSKPELLIEHSVTLTNLRAGQTYSFSATSTDVSGNTASSIDSMGPVASAQNGIGRIRANAAPAGFATNLTSDTVAPSITEGPTVLAVSDTTALIRWVTSEPADTRVEYGLQGQALSQFAGDMELCSEHILLLTNLSPSTAYSYRVGSQDPSGNGPTLSPSQSITTGAAPDTASPILSPLPWPLISDPTKATITWGTNEYATSQVFYGLDGAQLDMLAARTGLRGSHSIVLPNLQAGLQYYYQCASVDTAGNVVLSEVSSLSAELSTPTPTPTPSPTPTPNRTPMAASDWELFR